MGGQYYKKYTSEEIKAAFRHFDTNGDGYITPDVRLEFIYWYQLSIFNYLSIIPFIKELKVILAKMGRNYSNQEIARMIKSVDQDNNQKISIDEFALVRFHF
jgi:Ca2+-binding EF-hand superfamily protein